MAVFVIHNKYFWTSSLRRLRRRI